MKKILSICMVFVFLLMPLGSQVALAEEEKKQEQTGPTISENLFKGHTDDLYKGKYYEIDTEAPKKDDKGVLQKLGGYIFGDDNVGQDIQRMIYSICQWFVNLAFKLNIMLTQLTMFLVDQALKLDIVSGVADKLAAAMQNISGIGKGQDGKMGFLSGGLFPSIIGIACVLSACYAAYIFFVKRQPTAGFNELVKTVLVIAFILVFIGNASTVLKTTNTISSEISTTILAKATGTVAGDPNRSKEDAISAVKKQIWGILVERPYLFLQYGEDSKEKIGKERVDTLLKTSPGKERNSIVDNEIAKEKNQMMKMDSVGERIIFTIIYYIVNPLVGIPVLAFCLLIVAFQLWFLVMSLIAPIVLAVALLPGYRRVMESWATQWIRPLALKVLMSVMLVIIFTVSELIYVLPEAGLAGYVSTMVFQIIVFILCYIFRDSIIACFAKTKNIYRTVTDISLMTERFVDRGKDVAMGVGGYIGEQVGNHFNTAAELAANGVAVENEDTLDEEKKPNLMKANVPDNLSDDENQEQNNEQDENQKQLVSLQDEEQVTDTEEQEEQDLDGRQNLTHLDQEELAEIMERSEEVTPAELENDVSDQNYASLEELELTPEQEITSLQDAPQELSAIDIVDYPTNELETTTLSSNSTPAANPTNPIRKTIPVEPTQDQIIASPEISTPNVQEPLVSNEIPAQDIMVPVSPEQEIHPTLSNEPMPVEPTQDQVIATPEIPTQNIQEPMVSSEIPTQAITVPATHEQEIHPTLSSEP
ncbi:CPBP family intramembrane glutamate endopeptidase, partial [Bacillus sp. JJ864]|uniref:CD3337/EF1877 family mobilome membrane protein n=1 Tax=Bacillus sp. JJ864 TaxID=3122975 RepID=UPI002FFEB2EC